MYLRLSENISRIVEYVFFLSVVLKMELYKDFASQQPGNDLQLSGYKSTTVEYVIFFSLLYRKSKNIKILHYSNREIFTVVWYYIKHHLICKVSLSAVLKIE